MFLRFFILYCVCAFIIQKSFLIKKFIFNYFNLYFVLFKTSNVLLIVLFKIVIN